MFWTPVDRWLVTLADPMGKLHARLPSRLDAEGLKRLINAALNHGVLPAVLRHLQQHPETVLQNPEDFNAHRVSTGKILIEQAQLAMLLRQQAAELLRTARGRGMTMLVMKGPSFADAIYPEPGLRPFVDLDLLVERDHFREAHTMMRELGYIEHDEEAMKYEDGYAETLMYRPDQPGGPAELHWNLVNSPTLRRGLDVSLSDLQLEPDRVTPEDQPNLTAASHLLITVVHAAASHGYDKLQMAIDILQLARGAAGPIDTDWLQEAMANTGATLALAVGLDLTARLYPHDPAPRELLKQLDPRWSRFFWRRFVTPHLLITARDDRRYWGSFRRQWLRHRLKRGRGIK